ncbi:hypothetical protein IAR55_006323 [Kwoniella newhampshirensis]|uniref:AB hydrolase-1 domain-containing protein n=1 Tax=Kwoniella newhampshirensis TaxID=1651941 RepID=A0AAW0YV04_9TREE
MTSKSSKEKELGEHEHSTSFSLTSTLLYVFEPLLAPLTAALFFLGGCIGMASYARQIVKILPTQPGLLRIRNGSASGKEIGTEERSLTDWIRENVPSLKGVFRPAHWLPNGHLQTFYIVAGDFTQVDKVHYVRTYLRLPDGGTIGLDATPENHHELPPDAPTVVISHGLTGGSHESYVRNVLAWVVKPKSEGGLGGRGIVVNFRGCAGVPVTSCQLYSAGTTMDLALALHFVKNRHPQSPLHGVGFSLGASVLTRHLGEVGSSSLLSSGTVLGCPWDLTAMSHRLENDFLIARIYSSALGKNVLKLFFRAYESNPAIFEAEDSPVRDCLEDLKRQRKNMGIGSRLRKADDMMVSKIGGPRGIGAWPFPSAKEYYEWASPKNVLQGVKVPLLAINAFDDPVIDGEALPVEELQASSHIYAAVTGSGGHLGWFDGPYFDKVKSRQRWVLKPISEFLTAASRDLPLAEGKEVELVEEDGWEWVKKPAYEIPGVERIGWKVLREGEIVQGEDDEGEQGMTQGL